MRRRQNVLGSIEEALEAATDERCIDILDVIQPIAKRKGITLRYFRRTAAIAKTRRKPTAKAVVPAAALGNVAVAE